MRAVAASGTETGWSEPLTVTGGFLADGAWVAEPIGLAEPARPAQPALLRTTFTVEGGLRRATLYYAALGVAEPELNGARVDDDVLAPGWTSYRDRLVHETVDVTALVREGENVLGAAIAGAWYTEKYGFFQFADRVYGDQPSLLAQLHLEYADGRSEVVATGGGWRAFGDGPVVDSGIYAGEHADLRRTADVDGWSTPGFDASAWPEARRGASALEGYEHVPVPEARIAPPVHRIDELPVAEVLTSPSGATILDFGQNLVGRLRIRVDGPAGTRLTLRHAEVLEEGELSLRPLRNAVATDVLELAGDGAVVWEPRFTFHGFRYASIEGWPGEFDPAAVTAVVLASDLPRTGWFASSHELLDRLHENVVWGMRGNFLSIPTDCPQRDERLGWTGDIQVFTPTASFLADCDAFLTSWLRDLAHEQRRAHGAVPLVVPAALPSFGVGGPTAAWGDAATIVPWVLYERFGDAGVLRDAYPSMRDWVDAVLAVIDHPGLWSGHMQLGDWLDPDAPPDKPQKAKVDGDVVASAYLARSLRIVADAAVVLGDAADAEHYATLAERTRAAFVAEYVTPAGRMMSDATTAYALALGFDLVTDAAQRTRLAARLAELVRERGYRIATGFVGTPLVTDALADAGHRYAAERLLLQTECPSWLYPVTMGATTVWERWDSLLPDGSVNPGEMTSFNHYALGRSPTGCTVRSRAGSGCPRLPPPPHRPAAAREAVARTCRAPHALRPGIRRLAPRGRRGRGHGRGAAEHRRDRRPAGHRVGGRRIGASRVAVHRASGCREPAPAGPRLAERRDHRRPRGVPRVPRHARGARSRAGRGGARRHGLGRGTPPAPGPHVRAARGARGRRARPRGARLSGIRSPHARRSTREGAGRIRPRSARHRLGVRRFRPFFLHLVAPRPGRRTPWGSATPLTCRRRARRPGW